MLKTVLAAAIVAAGFAVATPASAGYYGHRHYHHHSFGRFFGHNHFYHGRRNSEQRIRSGGRGGAHHGERYGRTTY